MQQQRVLSAVDATFIGALWPQLAGRGLRLAASRRGFEQFDGGPHGHKELRCVIARLLSGGQRLRIAAETIAEK